MKVFIFIVFSSNAFFWSEAYKPLPDNYESLSAQTKLSLLWTKVLSEEYKKLPEITSPNIISFLSSSGSYLKISFSHIGDQMPEKRTKLIRPFGAVAKVSFKSLNNSYTGLYSGCSFGLIRFSIVDNKSFSPGVALKFLVDGRPSLNFMGMESISGSDKNFNFFAFKLSNILPKAKNLKGKAIDFVFKRAINPTNRLGITHLAKRDCLGNDIDDSKGLNVISLKPVRETQFSSKKGRDFRKDLKKLEVGSVLYEVWGNGEILGELVLESKVIASEYADKGLFFRHRPYRK